MCNVQVISLGDFVLPELQENKIKLLEYYPTTDTLRHIATETDTDYILFYTGYTPVHFSAHSLARMLEVAGMSNAGLLYSDYFIFRSAGPEPHPTLEYQSGSLRDDFDFGPVILYKTEAFRQAAAQMDTPYQYAALYDLRLKISRNSKIFHLPEYLYTVPETDMRSSGEKQFDYVNPRNRNVQIEMEKACTAHLKAIGAWLPPRTQTIDCKKTDFPVEASVIIPVRNRAKTIAEAVLSALNQQTSFSFNVIVTDNHSSDGTTGILHRLAAIHANLVHYCPAETNLGIGGCWNAALLHPQCGRFAIQLDSDDLYSHTGVIQTMVDKFYQTRCAMLIGSYRMVNDRLEEIPPGVIDHREWSDENGHNNALRINGLGAPRAFYTPVARKIKFPNVSYGEDYAIALAISRQYRIDRIYEPLYLCRRWEENSDASPGINKLNTYNFYKDKLRTLEIMERISSISKL